MSKARSPDGKLPTGMAVDEFLAWAPAQPGRYQLYCGTVYAMAAERVR